MTLQALRQKVGDTRFFTILRSWATQNRYGNVTTAQFIALSEQVSGIDLGHFFDVWLYTPEKPTTW
jgi:aminopeptidase N